MITGKLLNAGKTNNWRRKKQGVGMICYQN